MDDQVEPTTPIEKFSPLSLQKIEKSTVKSTSTSENSKLHVIPSQKQIYKAFYKRYMVKSYKHPASLFYAFDRFFKVHFDSNHPQYAKAIAKFHHTMEKIMETKEVKGVFKWADVINSIYYDFLTAYYGVSELLNKNYLVLLYVYNNKKKVSDSEYKNIKLFNNAQLLYAKGGKLAGTDVKDKPIYAEKMFEFYIIKNKNSDYLPCVNIDDVDLKDTVMMKFKKVIEKKKGKNSDKIDIFEDDIDYGCCLSTWDLWFDCGQELMRFAVTVGNLLIAFTSASLTLLWSNDPDKKKYLIQINVMCKGGIALLNGLFLGLGILLSYMKKADDKVLLPYCRSRAMANDPVILCDYVFGKVNKSEDDEEGDEED